MSNGSPNYIVGVDLGQSNDYTAIVIVQRIPRQTGKAEEQRSNGQWSAREEWEDHFEVRYIDRAKLHTPYPVIADTIHKMMVSPTLAGDVALVVDATGVGRPVVDMMRAKGLSPVPVTITGGDATTHEDDAYKIPKRVLVAQLQILFQCERLKIASAESMAGVLRAELENFKVKINRKTAHDSYGADKDGDHDDLVLAASLAAWWAVKTRSPQWLPTYKRPAGTLANEQALHEATGRRLEEERCRSVRRAENGGSGVRINSNRKKEWWDEP